MASASQQAMAKPVDLIDSSTQCIAQSPFPCLHALTHLQVLLAQQQTVAKLMDLINQARAGLVEEVCEQVL